MEEELRDPAHADRRLARAPGADCRPAAGPGMGHRPEVLERGRRRDASAVRPEPPAQRGGVRELA
eukprot:6346222-Lingulodinium_polyedra.AAC.1